MEALDQMTVQALYLLLFLTMLYVTGEIMNKILNIEKHNYEKVGYWFMVMILIVFPLVNTLLE